MARFENLYINKLRVNKIYRTTDSGLYTIDDLTVVAGENATTALSQQTTLRWNAYSSDQFVLGATVNAAPFRFIAGAISEVGLLTGTTVGNMASTDRISAMTVKKGGLGNYIVVKAATVAGTAGDTTIVVNDPLILATDYAFGQVRVTGTGARTVSKMVCTAGVLTITLSGAMTAAHTVDYAIVRSAGIGTESHRIAVVGNGALAAVGAGTSDTVVATGVASGDVILITALTQTETDHYILDAVPTKDTITLTFSGAPGVTTIGWVALRPV
jgi:hypothetical protein